MTCPRALCPVRPDVAHFQGRLHLNIELLRAPPAGQAPPPPPPKPVAFQSVPLGVQVLGSAFHLQDEALPARVPPYPHSPPAPSLPCPRPSTCTAHHRARPGANPPQQKPAPRRARRGPASVRVRARPLGGTRDSAVPSVPVTHGLLRGALRASCFPVCALASSFRSKRLLLSLEKSGRR